MIFLVGIETASQTSQSDIAEAKQKLTSKMLEIWAKVYKLGSEIDIPDSVYQNLISLQATLLVRNTVSD